MRDKRRGAPSDFGGLAPLKTLFETRRGRALPLPPKLARLYGHLRMPLPGTRPHVFSNFVTTLDGVVSLNTKGHASGGDLTGFSAQDRMVMGLCRAIANVVTSARVRSPPTVGTSGQPQPSFGTLRMNIDS